jgi:hypothetical protein
VEINGSGNQWKWKAERVEGEVAKRSYPGEVQPFVYVVVYVVSKYPPILVGLMCEWEVMNVFLLSVSVFVCLSQFFAFVALFLFLSADRLCTITGNVVVDLSLFSCWLFSFFWFFLPP